MELRILNVAEDKSNKLFESNDCQTLLKMYDDFYPKIGFNLPWVAYLILRHNQVVGLGSFKGQPKEGKVEIAYWTFNEFEGEGIASFACKELIAISQNADPKVIITATTAPEHNASTKILENNGFVFVEIVQDEEIGDAWLWILKKE
jgi:[ribosomal protein S5]-alanine N-acetyltransferase